MKVLVLDDHPIVLRGCAHLLEDTEATHFIGAADIEEGFVAYKRERPDLVIVDLAFGRDTGRGLDFIQRLRDQEGSTPIIVLSAHTDLNLVSKAVQLGASAYVLKDASAREFRQAFHSVLAGKRYMSEGLAEQFAFNATSKRHALTNLTTNEYRVLELMAGGKTYDVIAAKLDISKKTVVQTVASLKIKLGAPTLNDLLYFAVAANGALKGDIQSEGSGRRDLV
jgi:two-component system, NarL family, invasion response regulator UvrY